MNHELATPNRSLATRLRYRIAVRLMTDTAPEYGPLTVRCPTCRANPGEPCVTIGAKQPMTLTHKFRRPYSGPKDGHMAGQYRQQNRRPTR